jgi:cell division protein FtsW
VYRGYQIARGVKDPFGKYLAFGISSLILIQVFVNIGVNLNVIPLTGVTLPFVSYGGSSLITLMIGIGILLNISRYVEYRAPSGAYESVKKRRVYSDSI